MKIRDEVSRSPFRPRTCCWCPPDPPSHVRKVPRKKPSPRVQVFDWAVASPELIEPQEKTA